MVLEYCKAPWTTNGRWRYINAYLFLSEFARRWPLKFSLEFRLSTGVARAQAIVAAQNGGGLPSRPAFPSSPGTVLIVGG